MTERERQILALIREDPMISQQDIAARLGISRSAVAGHIMHLSEKGIVKGRGYVISDAPFVAVIGGANLDIHGRSARNVRLHDSNPGVVVTSPGGVARNVAENLARLGADCRLITAIGLDPHGQILLQQGREAGIDMRHVAQLDNHQTSTYLSVLDHSGNMHVGISDMSIIDELGPEKIRTHEAMLKQAALIIIDTNLNDDALAYVAGTFGDKPIFADTVSTTKATRIKPYLSAVHTLKPSLIEAEALAGMRSGTDKQLPKLAMWFHERGVKRLFITLGARGVFYSTADASGIEKSNLKNIRNVGGAGDAFLAALAYGWLREWTLGKSIKFSLAAAGVTISNSKTSSPTLSLAAVNRVMKASHAR